MIKPTCRTCGHRHGDPPQVIPQCTLNPIWLPVENIDSHWCGSHTDHTKPQVPVRKPEKTEAPKPQPQPKTTKKTGAKRAR